MTRIRPALVFAIALAVATMSTAALGPAARIGDAAAASEPSGSSPREAVKQATDEVLVILARRSAPRDEKIAQIELVADRYFDFTTMARLALGRPWNDLDEAQRTDLVREFQKHLSVTYGRNLERYDDQKIAINGDREEARGDWTVKTAVVDPKGGDALIDYRLRRDPSGAWKIIDVTVEGIGLIANFRDQFQSIAARDGAARVGELLREKNARGESLIDPNKKAPGPS